jgi:sulfite reductase (ferredoxin)
MRPENIDDLKILGVYQQRDKQFFMQRLKICGGRITIPQWRKVAQLAIEYSDGYPLHVTTRQDIELHNIKFENICDVQKGLYQVGLNTYGACGDTIRNITVCTCCGRSTHGLEVLPMAQFIQINLRHIASNYSLPRKFKIAFSGCQKGCGKPYINDLAFLVQRNKRFTVIGAGSLGAKPNLGIQLYKDLPSRDVLPLCIAATQFFEKYGDRENRNWARFRHIREVMGDDRFKAALDIIFRKTRDSKPWPDFILPLCHPEKRLFTLQLPDGNITPEDALTLAEHAEHAEATLRINLEHGLELFGEKEFKLPLELSKYTNNPVIVACPGFPTCPRGLADTCASAAVFRKNFSNEQLKGLNIHISGCPNNCAQSAIADIGLIGIVRKKDGQSQQAYKILTGGGNGRNDTLAQHVDTVFADELPQALKKLIDQLSLVKA